MQKFEKLKQNYEFRRLYAKGTACVCPAVILYLRKGRAGKIRIGLTAGKKLGCAVDRNRAKRVMYAAFCECLPGLPVGYDYVLVARTRILSQKSTQVAAALKKQLTALSIWCDS